MTLHVDVYYVAAFVILTDYDPFYVWGLQNLLNCRMLQTIALLPIARKRIGLS